MAKNKKFPEFIFIARQAARDLSTWLAAKEKPEQAIEYDGPTSVATYKLVETNRLSKRVVSKPDR